MLPCVNMVRGGLALHDSTLLLSPAALRQMPLCIKQGTVHIVRHCVYNKALCMPFCVQASLRSKLGEGTTAFERITDGARVVCRGDVVRINVKPLLVGRVTAFTIPQVGDGSWGWGGGEAVSALTDAGNWKAALCPAGLWWGCSVVTAGGGEPASAPGTQAGVQGGGAEAQPPHPG